VVARIPVTASVGAVVAAAEEEEREELAMLLAAVEPLPLLIHFS